MDIVEKYRRGELPVPENHWVWFLYGAGLENLGRDGRPELRPVPTYGPTELLARVDACGICFSDIKIIKAGAEHPRLYGRDLANDPIVIGHEVALTIVGVGDEMRGQYNVGDRFVVQADVYYKGVNLAFGYMLYGGFEQYVKLGDEVLRGDDGCYLIPIRAPELGYAEAALAEPWACVVCSYRWMHRRQLKHGGATWIIGTPEAQNKQYTLGALQDGPPPARVMVTDVPESLQGEVARLIAKWGARQCVGNGLSAGALRPFAESRTEGAGVDDIIILGGDRPEVIEECSAVLAREGILTIVTDHPLARPVSIDVGRVHYDQIRFLGCTGPDISVAYVESREPRLEPGGKFWVVGAGGPMGQMHVQWALEQPEPPEIIVASDIDRQRLAIVAARFSAVAQQRGSRLECLNPKEMEPAEFEQRLRELAPSGFDDICVLVPVPAIISDCARYLGRKGMLNIFGGVGRGTMAEIDLSPMALSLSRLQGTSGSDIEDLEMTLRLTEEGRLNTNMSVAAICGIDGAKDGLQAVVDARYPGKTVVYPQVEGLGLVGLDELPEALPNVAQKLSEGAIWSREAELELLRKFLPAKYPDV
ncbi:MAG: alcohol dehydrogenase catalytic domain-containing protein [Armatimonadetes bacterium]|nr:alcohol dehydrogenase catalytic domain-containing protein [Armatimonadota bacterium]